MRSLLSYHGNAGILIEVVFAIFAAVVDKKILLFINELQNIPLACLKIWGQLDGQSRTRLLTEASVDTSGKVDPEPSRIAPSVFPFSRLHGDATDRANR